MQIDRSCLARFLVLVLAMLAIMSLVGNAQTTSATLTGTVFDSSGAVVPKATVSLKNEASGDMRSTVANGDGYFTFAAIPPGSYTIRVEMAGFSAWETTSVVLNASDKRNVSLGSNLRPARQKKRLLSKPTPLRLRRSTRVRDRT